MEQTVQTIALPLPEGWLFKESITLIAPDLRANVIASSEPVAPDLDAAAYAAVQGKLLHDEFPQYKELAIESLTLEGGLPAMLRRFRWTPPEAEEVTQLQLYYAEGGRGYTVTATAPTEDFSRYDVLMAAIVRGLRIRRPEVLAAQA